MHKKEWRPNKELFESLLKIDKRQFSRCLEPSFKCTERAIRSHSVQNSRILDRLVHDGHVIGLVRSVSLDQGPQIKFSLVGRNRAMTFTGLCAYHDNLIFSPIEKEELDLENQEHLFLLAYRAAYRELHATMEAAVKGSGRLPGTC